MDFATASRENNQPFIQAKLTIGQPNDKYEQEADAVADRVIKMSNNESPGIQRKCTVCEKEELQMKPLGSSIGRIVQRQEGNADTIAPTNISQTLSQSKGSGESLPESTQSLMGSGIGADFSHVKVHTDENAIQMNRQLNAKAFTNGSDIYFNQGQYNPQSSEGKHLLAHELTHTIQQSETSTIQRWFKGTDRAPVPAGTTNHVGSMGSAEWLQGHRNAGNPISEGITFVFVGSSLSSQTTTDIATRCNQHSSFSDRIICLHNEVHSAVMALEGSDGDLTDGDYVCRNYAAAVHDVSQQMGLSPDWETSTTHAWVEFTDGGRQYVVDAYNRILFSHPIR